jgi:tRNA threonylcarbamoyladenosine biosynthesis protein TsaB
MPILTLSTSTAQGSLVLSRESEIIEERVWLKEKSHSEKITVEIEDALKTSGLGFKDLNLLICSQGPGSFTGIRVALSVVKTLAYAYKLSIIAIDDCLAVALNSKNVLPSLPIAVMIDAQKNKVFLATYRWEQGNLLTESAPQLVGLEQIENYLPDFQYLCLGDGFAPFNNFFSDSLKIKLQRNEKVSDLPSAKTIFSYISPRRNDFTKISWENLQPIYLRQSAAEEVLAEKRNKI